MNWWLVRLWGLIAAGLEVGTPVGSESSASRGEGSLGRAAAGCMAAGGEPILGWLA